MYQKLALPPGHKVTITVDGDAKAMGVSVVVHRGEEWIGELTFNEIGDVQKLQDAVDMLTRRGPKLVK
jgi:hypothetical protein